jgi:hypothetical protein
MIIVENYENFMNELENADFNKKKKDLAVMVMSKEFKTSKIGEKFLRNTYFRLNNVLVNRMGFPKSITELLEKPCEDDISNIANCFLQNVTHLVFYSITFYDFIFKETKGFPMEFLKSLPDIKNMVDKILPKKESNFKEDYGLKLFERSFTSKVYSQIEDLVCFALYSEIINNPKMLSKADFLTKKFSFGKTREFNLLLNICYIIANNVSLTFNDENNSNIFTQTDINNLEKANSKMVEENKKLKQQIETKQSETERLLNKIKALEEKNNELQKTINKKDKELLKKEHQVSSIKNIETVNSKIQKAPKEEVIEVTNEEIKEVEIESIDTDKKLLFIGGHTSTVKKLKNLYKNSDGITSCSTMCSANYIKKFDGIVFLTNFISHALYEKIKNVAKPNNCKWIHCHSDNVDLIVKEINKNFAERTLQAV